MKVSPLSWLCLLLALVFTLASCLVTPAEAWGERARSDNIFGKLFGDGRKLFANHFFTMADVYFHSGYYPSVFDQKEDGPKAIVTAAEADNHDPHAKPAASADADGHEDHDDHDGHDHSKCEEQGGFLGKPKDWIEAFSRNFRITEHTHLEHNNEREILPWLRLAAELDPHKIETYTVGAFFLQEHLNRPDQAEAFLREGLQNNPDSAEILFELGRVYRYSRKDLDHARNVWQLGVNRFLKLTPEQQKEDKLILQKLTLNLARLEEDAGRYPESLNWFRLAQKLSVAPEAIQEQIDAVQKKMSADLAPLVLPNLLP